MYCLENAQAVHLLHFIIKWFWSTCLNQGLELRGQWETSTSQVVSTPNYVEMKLISCARRLVAWASVALG